MSNLPGEQTFALSDITEETDRGKQVVRPEGRRWYVNGQGQPMVLIPGPVEFMMGSPRTEAGGLPQEQRPRKRIGQLQSANSPAPARARPGGGGLRESSG